MVDADADWYADRQAIYKKIEVSRKSRVIAYVTGDRQGMQTQISPEAVDIIGNPRVREVRAHSCVLVPTRSS
jgi:hypothetical protein